MDADDSADSTWLIEGGSDPAEVAGRYDRWATAYDRDLDSWSYRAPEVAAAQVMALRSDAQHVLDAGCGTGLVGRALRQAGYVGELHGIDVSEASLEVAGATGAYTSLATADLQGSLDLPDDRFDALTCIGVMTYVPEVEAAWREFARLVRPGGLIVVTQRDDLWEARDCASVVERLSLDGIWAAVEVDGPAPYLPGNTDGMADVGVYYLIARVA